MPVQNQAMAPESEFNPAYMTYEGKTYEAQAEPKSPNTCLGCAFGSSISCPVIGEHFEAECRSKHRPDGKGVIWIEVEQKAPEPKPTLTFHDKASVPDVMVFLDDVRVDVKPISVYNLELYRLLRPKPEGTAFPGPDPAVRADAILHDAGDGAFTCEGWVDNSKRILLRLKFYKLVPV